MSEKCARECNIYHLIDTRFHGMAAGVGTAPILGRVHVANMQLGNSVFVSSFTIMKVRCAARTTGAMPVLTRVFVFCADSAGRSGAGLSVGAGQSETPSGVH